MIAAISTTYTTYTQSGPGNPGVQAANADIRDRELQRSAPADNTATQSSSRQSSAAETGLSDLRGDQRVDGSRRLSDVDRQLVDQLAARDREVRTHEQAHQAAGGGLTGSASYTYQVGPDGKRYAIGGEVSIQAPVATGDPEADLKRAQTILRSAMAPSEPSGQDLRVAAQARALAADAAAALVAERAERGGSEEASESEREQVTVGQSDNPEDVTATDRYYQTQAERETSQSELETQQAAREQRAERMEEYQQEMAQVQQRLAEVNQLLARAGVLNTDSLVGSLINDQA